VEPVHWAVLRVHTPGLEQVPPFWHVDEQTARKIIERFLNFWNISVIINKTEVRIYMYLRVRQVEPDHDDVHVHTPGLLQVPLFWHADEQTARKIIERFFNFWCTSLAINKIEVNIYIYLRVWQLEPVHWVVLHVHTPGLEQVPPFWHVGEQTGVWHREPVHAVVLHVHVFGALQLPLFRHAVVHTGVLQ